MTIMLGCRSCVANSSRLATVSTAPESTANARGFQTIINVLARRCMRSQTPSSCLLCAATSWSPIRRLHCCAWRIGSRMPQHPLELGVRRATHGVPATTRRRVPRPRHTRATSMPGAPGTKPLQAHSFCNAQRGRAPLAHEDCVRHGHHHTAVAPTLAPHTSALAADVSAAAPGHPAVRWCARTVAPSNS